jgi:hypothetical protein
MPSKHAIQGKPRKRDTEMRGSMLEARDDPEHQSNESLLGDAQRLRWKASHSHSFAHCISLRHLFFFSTTITMYH